MFIYINTHWHIHTCNAGSAEESKGTRLTIALICIHTYKYVYTYKHIYAHICSHLNCRIFRGKQRHKACASAYMYTRTYIYVCIYTHTNAYMQLYVHTCTAGSSEESKGTSPAIAHICIHTLTHTYVHIYIHTTHIYTHTYAFTPALRDLQRKAKAPALR